MPDRHQVWAAPLTFGPWAVIASHLNSVTYKVEVTPIGDVPTLFIGELRYWNEDNEQVVLSFKDSETITTGNSIGNVEIRTPTGVSCYVDVSG
ncbi:MAG: hypothetical protein V8K32_11790 [Candidatus Electrothrix gigas]